MRHFSPHHVLYLSALLLLVAACGNSKPSSSNGIPGTPSQGTQGIRNPCDKTEFSIIGKVVNISHNANSNFIGEIMLIATTGQQVSYHQAKAQVRSTAKIFEKQGNQCQTVAFSTIKSGQQVQILSTGTVMQSDPALIEAIEVVILP